MSETTVPAVREGGDLRVYQDGAVQRGSNSPFDGADRFGPEVLTWDASFASPDSAINNSKPLVDARVRDVARNNGLIAGAITTHKDSIVGAQFRLNAKPKWRYLSTLDARFTPEWAKTFQQTMEDRFNLLADSNSNWLDYTRRNTLTSMIRMAVGVFFKTGEICAPVEWIRNDPTRPVQTAVHLVSSDRLCNPNNIMDTATLRRGVQFDGNGAPLAYNVLDQDPYAFYSGLVGGGVGQTWTTVPARKPWGRTQFIHIIEQQDPDQTRGVSDLVTALTQTRMLKNFQRITLQNAVINASIAAVVESELPSDMVKNMIAGGDGMTPDAMQQAYGSFLSMMEAYVANAPNIRVGGAKVAHTFPGTKLNVKTLGTPGGVGTDFEKSFIRHMAAALNLSYEELSRDLSDTNYTSIRAGIAQTSRTMKARKRNVADRFATEVYALVYEEWLNDGLGALPPGVDPAIFYQPLAKEALTSCQWIASGRGQIDEMKETQAAILRIAAGLSTYEIECAQLGYDFRDIFEQAQREQEQITTDKLVFTLAAGGQGGGGQSGVVDKPTAASADPEDKDPETDPPTTKAPADE
ncbi:MAG: phage portal protein [Janthinobacterium lividum]